MLTTTLQSKPQWVRFALIGMAVVLAALGVMLGGGYVKAAGLVREGDALMAEGQYEAAKAAYEKAKHFWPPSRDELKLKFELAETLLAQDQSLSAGLVHKAASEWQACVDVLAKMTEDHAEYSKAAAAATECQSQLTATTPSKVSEPTPTDTTTKTIAKSSATEAATTNTTTESSSSSTPSDSSSDESSGSESSPQSSEQSSGSGSTESGAAATEEEEEEEDQPPTPPVLKNLGVAFAPYDAMTGRAGAFDFLKLQRKPFTPFGDNGSEPTFTYLVAEDADVMAVADGYVSKVEYQSTYSDYSIMITTEPDNQGYSIDYDHILSPTVAAGAQVAAGKVLGKAGTHSDEGIGRVEIQVFLGGQSITSYCPFTYFDSALRATYEAKLATLMADYELFNYNTTHYDESADDAYGTGCLAATTGG